MRTDHLYYRDTELYSNTAKVLDVREEESKDGRKLVVLVTDRTVMHPQGGTKQRTTLLTHFVL